MQARSANSEGSANTVGSATNTDAGGAVRQFFAGAGYLGRGLGMWATSPKLMLIGAIPALLVGAVYTIGLVFFAVNLPAISVWVTPFAAGWDDPFRIATRIAADIAAVGIVILLALFTYTAITLMVGDPFYERIWREVEYRAGGAPDDSGESLARSLVRGIGNGIRLFAATALAGLALFAGGFIPIVGQTIIPVLGVAIGGWFLTTELTGFAFDARGLTLRQRRRMLGSRRASTLGFGMATYLLFLVPFGAVIVMPAAVAGATLLSRSVIAGSVASESSESSPRPEPSPHRPRA